MKLLALLLISGIASAQTCNQAVVTQGAGTMNISLAGCGGAPVVPPVVVPPPDQPPPPPVVVIPPVPADGLPNPSKFAFRDGPPHAGLNGAGGRINAWAMDPSTCKTTPALTRSWQHNIDLQDYKSQNAFDLFAMPAGESLSYKFTVPTFDAAGGFLYNDSSGSGGNIRPVFISITTERCNFDATRVSGPTQSSCFQTGINGLGVNWANLTIPIPPSYCRLVKGQTYFVNLRFQHVIPGQPLTDSCTEGRLCGGLLQLL